MLRKAELRKLAVDFPHHEIAGDFGDDTGGCNRDRKAVTFDDGVIGKREIPHWESVDQAVVWLDVQSFDRTAHRKMGCPQDVELVDFLTTCSRDRPNDVRISGQSSIKGLAFGRA